MHTKKLTRLALLTAIALTIFVIEAQIPLPLPIPGLRLGLSNIVTVYAVFALGPWSALGILLSRVILGALVTGRMMALAYSLAGGLLSWAAMCLLRPVLAGRQIWAASIVGGIFHNIGQMAMAIVIAATPSLIVYLPALLAMGMVTGLFTGLCAQYLLRHMKQLKH